MPKKHRVPKEGPAVFQAPPEADQRPSFRIPVTLLSGKRGWLHGRFPVVPKLKTEDGYYAGTVKKDGTSPR